MRFPTVLITWLWLCLFFSLKEVLGQSKEPKGFDLNKTPPPENGSEDEVVQSRTIERTSMAANTLSTKETEVSQKTKKRKRKPEQDPKEEAEHKKAYFRDKSRERRKGIRERKLTGTLTESDIRSLELSKSRRERYIQTHKESLRKYYSDYRRSHLSECAAKQRKWRSNNSVKARQADKRHRLRKLEKKSSPFKMEQNSIKRDRLAPKE